MADSYATTAVISEVALRATSVGYGSGNDDFSQPLVPAKRHFRSETVDSQRGEVEWRGGNLYCGQITTSLAGSVRRTRAPSDLPRHANPRPRLRPLWLEIERLQ